MAWIRTAAQVYADGPVGTPLQPAKSEIRPLLLQYENAIDSLTIMLGAAVGAVKGTKAQLDAVAGSHANGDVGVVFADTDSLNGIYVLTAGVWLKQSDLPGSTAAASAAAAAASAALAAAQASNSLSSANASATSANASATSANAAALYASTALSAAELSGDIKYFGTKAALTAGFASFADGKVFQVIQDESQGNDRTFYIKQSGALTYFGKVSNSRKQLAADITYFVRSDGSDSNDGLSNTSGGAFATKAAAIAAAYKLDTFIHAVKIKVGPGADSANGVALYAPLTGGGNFIFEGDIATPSNCPVHVTGIQHAFYAAGNVAMQVRGFDITVSGGTGWAAMRADNGAVISQGSNRFGPCTGMHFDMGLTGIAYCYWDYEIYGGAVGHWHCGSPSAIYSAGITITLTGVPAFSAYFAGTASGNIFFGSTSFAGTATGFKYYAHKNGVIDGSGAGYDALPGSMAGTVRTGGRYLGPTIPDVAVDIVNIFEQLVGFSTPGYFRQTTDDVYTGPFIIADRNKTAPAANDAIASFVAAGRNSTALQRFYTAMESVIVSPTNGAEASLWRVGTYVAGAYAPRVTVGGGLYMTGATGGDRGAGTINATDYYNDNVVLTCMALAAEFRDTKTIDLAYWDSKVPDLVIPEAVEHRPVMEKVNARVKTLSRADDGSTVIKYEDTETMRQKVYLVPVWDEVGNGVDVIEEPLTERVTIAEQTIQRLHGTARIFKAMVEDGFDPRDPQQYFDKLQTEEALPGMPTKAAWVHGSLSTGELFNRKWLAIEMLAIVCHAMWIKLNDIDQRVSNLEGGVKSAA